MTDDLFSVYYLDYSGEEIREVFDNLREAQEHMRQKHGEGLYPHIERVSSLPLEA